MKPALLTSLLGLLALTGCGQHDPAAPPKTLPPLSVKTAPATLRTNALSEIFPGTVRSRLHAVLEPKVSGRIVMMPALLGQKVQKGERLATLEAGEIQAQVEVAKATLQHAQADLKRYAALLAQQAVTQAEFDAVQARFRVAEASYKQAEIMASYTHIEAPFEGVIVRKWAEVGDLAAPGKALVELEDAARLRFVAELPEGLMGSFTSGHEHRIAIPSLNREFPGTLAEVGPSADVPSRSFSVQLNLPADAELRSGQFGRLLLPSQHPTLTIPLAGLVRRGQLDLVYVITTNRAQLRLVRPGQVLGQEVELLSGVIADERVVLNPPPALRDGQAVLTTP